MKVTVKDCLELRAFKGARVVAGSAGLGNDVKAVSVLEAAAPSEVTAYAGDKGELLLTGFFAVRDDVAQQCQIVKQVAADGHAALVVFYVGTVVGSLDKKVVEACLLYTSMTARGLVRAAQQILTFCCMPLESSLPSLFCLSSSSKRFSSWDA